MKLVNCLLILLMLFSLLFSGCGNNEIKSKPEATVHPPSKTPTAQNIPSLDQYVETFTPIADQIEGEYKKVINAKGPSDEIRKHHWELDEQIKQIHVKNAKYYIHNELSAHLGTAHGYIVFLWQAYQNNNNNDINKFSSLIQQELTEFRSVAEKIKTGKIKYENLE